MAVHRSLYQVLQIGSVATPEEIAAAHRARTLMLESASTPANLAERSLVKDAFEILSDPARRKQYDEQLRERNMRALASGATAPRSQRTEVATPVPTPWWKSYAAIGFLVIAGMVGTWLYLDHQRKIEALRIEKERAAAEARRQAEEIRLREQDAAVKHGTVDWAKDRFDKAYKYSTERQQRAWQYEQQRQAAQDDMVRRRAEDATRRAEYEQRRREQDSVRQAQQQLERDRRHLQELERNRGMKF